MDIRTTLIMDLM